MGNITNYKLFLMAIQMGSVTRAAEAMNIDRTAAGRRIKSLEESVGEKLLLSTNRGCKLTESGYVLSKQIKRIVQEENLMRESICRKKDKIKIVSTSSIISNYLTKVLPKFVKENSDVNIELASVDHYKDLKDYSYDVALLPRTAHNTPFIQTELFTMTLRLYASKDYIKTHGRIKSIQDIEAHALITFGHQLKFDLGLPSWPLCAMENPHNIRSHIAVNCVNSMIGLAEDGVGVIGVSERYVEMNEAQLEKIAPDISQDNGSICIMHPSESLNMPLIQTLKDFLLSVEGK